MARQSPCVAGATHHASRRSVAAKPLPRISCGTAAISRGAEHRQAPPTTQGSRRRSGEDEPLPGGAERERRLRALLPDADQHADARAVERSRADVAPARAEEERSAPCDAEVGGVDPARDGARPVGEAEAEPVRAAPALRRDRRAEERTRAVEEQDRRVLRL